MRFFKFLVCLLLLVTSWVSAGMTLKDNISRAQSGDYVVVVHGKAYTLLRIIDNQNHKLSIEEITVPCALMKRGSWQEWLDQGAPQHSSWFTYTIDLDNNKVENCYSVARQGWVDAVGYDNFLPTVLNLDFEKIPLNERRRIGGDSVGGGKLWQPKLVYEGKKIPNIVFDGWRSRWPNDDTELSDRTIEIYLPQDQGKYISYFPYWLQTYGAWGKAYLRVIDSGRNLSSPKLNH